MKLPAEFQATKTTGAIMALGAVIFAAGVVRFVLHRHFTLAEAMYCLLAIPAAIFLLMVFDYTLHHARIASVIALAMLVFWMVMSPSFCVGVGLVLLGMVVFGWP